MYLPRLCWSRAELYDLGEPDLGLELGPYEPGPSNCQRRLPKGTAGRQKLQAELALTEGHFFEKVFQAALRRMDPAMGSEASSSMEAATKGPVMTRYLERFGGYDRQKDLGLIQWQLAQSLDLMARGEVKGAADVIALLAVMIDQMALDGKSELAWLFTLQQDPPAAVFQNH